MINIFTERTEQALKTHRKKLKVDLIERLKRRLGKNENELIRGQYEKLVSFLENNVEEIIGGKIKDVILLQIKLYDKLGYSEALRGDLEYVFNYKWFRSSKKKYDGFKLAKELAIDVCPYCNRNYTTSHRIDGTLKNVFPEFDHFYPQKDFPLLALSFYNLIPSCSICNSHYKKGENPDLRNIYYLLY